MVTVPYAPAEVGKRIVALREALGRTQADFARDLDVKPQELNAWEKGERRPSIAKALPMVAMHGVTLDWLFLGDPSNLPHRVAKLVLASKREHAQPDQG